MSKSEIVSRRGSVKVEEGKLVKVDVKIGNEMIEELKVHGDFFLEPANGIKQIEDQFEELELPIENKNELLNDLEELNVRTIGFEFEDLFKAVEEAVKND